MDGPPERMMRRAGIASTVTALFAAAPAGAQTIPFADTEDAMLSEIAVGAGTVHPVVSIDLRNGDYARGGYDDDDAGLGRVPLHVAVGGAIVLDRRAGGAGRLFLIGQSSNGVHTPRSDERARPRGWYESNTLLGVAWRPADGINAAATYTIKASPNGVAATTHEASLTFLYAADDRIGRWQPRVALTRRTRGNGGIYTIAGIAPSFDLLDREDGPALGVPVTMGVGWGGFYAADSGSRAFGSGGISLSQPVRIGGGRATLQAEVIAVLRDDRLRRLDGPAGRTGTLVPYATLSLAVAW